MVSIAAVAASLAGCAMFSSREVAPRLTQRDCLARVMYFESNRSSDDGMIAVGTVVMNRLKSGRYPDTICGVVGQPNQFAPGVLTRPMNDAGRERAYQNADRVMRGARHTGVTSTTMFFHTAGYHYPYSNMHYMTVAGGNAFYEKRKAPPGGWPSYDAPTVMVAQNFTKRPELAPAPGAFRPSRNPAPAYRPAPSFRPTAPAPADSDRVMLTALLESSERPGRY